MVGVGDTSREEGSNMSREEGLNTTVRSDGSDIAAARPTLYVHVHVALLSRARSDQSV